MFTLFTHKLLQTAAERRRVGVRISAASALFAVVPAALLLLNTAGRAEPGGPHGLRSSAQQATKKRHVELRNRLHGISGRIRRVRSHVQKAKITEIHISESIETVQARMAVTRKQLQRTNEQLEILDAESERVRMRLEETQKKLAARKNALQQRILANYEHGQRTYLQTLIEAKSLHEMLSRAYFVKIIVHSDSELIAAVRSDIRRIEADRQLLERQTAQKRSLADQLEAKKQEYTADLARERVLLHGVKAERIQAEQELDDLESEATAMANRIRELSETLRRQQQEERRAAAAAARAGRRHVAKPTALPTVYHGGFIRPCLGPLTSGFGMRFHPILHRTRMHAGVDFGGGFGAPIRAAGRGIVILSAYNRGYGNCIIIDHGGGVTTLYGHCSERLVNAGDTVRQGQLIGKVGASGLATGPHLHFEVRRNGTPVAPY